MLTKQDNLSGSEPRPTGEDAPRTTLIEFVTTRLRWYTSEHVPLKAMANFWSQLTLLIEVGVSLLRALYQIEARTSHPRLRQVIRHMAEAVERGSSFSEALAQHPRVFSQLMVQIIQVAERGGVFEDSLRLVADEVERHMKIQGQIKRALAYPVTIAICGLFVVLAVLIFVMPGFASLFQEQGLPMPTRVFAGTAQILMQFWWLFVLFVMGAWWALVRYMRTPRGGLFWDRLLLRLPVVGELLIRAGVLRFAQTLGTLLRGGVPILVALKLVQEHAENRMLAQELERTYLAVEQGSRLEEPLRRSKIFPPLAVDVIAIGEEAGQLATVLFKLAEAYKDEVDQTASIFSSIIEPVLLVLMGLLVAFIVWAVYLPYFTLPSLF